MMGSAYRPAKLGAVNLWTARTTGLEGPECWNEGWTAKMKRAMVTAEMRGSAAATEWTGARLKATVATARTGAECLWAERTNNLYRPECCDEGWKAKMKRNTWNDSGGG